MRSHDRVPRGARVSLADFDDLAKSEVPWAKLNGASVLVTGGTGLVGGWIVEVLLGEHGVTGLPVDKVIVVCRSEERARTRFRHLPSTRIAFVEHHLDGPFEYEGQVDFVIHAASLATPTGIAGDPIGTYLPNVVGTHYLLKWSADHHVKRFCFVSSGAVHGELPALTSGFNEETFGSMDPLDPYSSYAEAKRMGEAECVAWYRQIGMETSIIRLGHTYGAGLSRDDTRSFAQFVFNAVDGNNIVLNSLGSARRPFCYLTDAVTAIFLVLIRGKPGEAYLALNDQATLSIRELAELVARLAPPPGIEVKIDPSIRPTVYQTGPDAYEGPDTTKIRSLGWESLVTPDEGFGRTIQATSRIV